MLPATTPRKDARAASAGADVWKRTMTNITTWSPLASGPTSAAAFGQFRLYALKRWRTRLLLNISDDAAE